MVGQDYGTTGLRKNSQGEIVQVINKHVIVSLVYITLVLDNILLTVVVPIIPVFLHQHEIQIKTSSGSKSNNMTRIYEVIKHSDENEQKKAEILNILHRIFQSSVHGPKMTHPTEMISENGRIGALFASKAFVQLLVNPLVGKATNQYGYEWPFIFGTGVLLISSFIFAIVTSFPWLLFARSLQGIASACIAVAGMGMIADLNEDDEERSRIMGQIMGGIAAGVLIGYPLGGFLYDFIGESSPFILLVIVTGFIWGLQFRAIQPQKFNSIKENEEDDSIGYQKLFANYKILVVSGAIWVSTSAMALLEPCLPIWLMDNVHPEKWQLGTVFLPDSVGYLIGTNFFAVPALKWGRHKTAMVALFLVAMSAISIPFARSMWDLVLPHFFLGLGIGIVDSSLMPLLAKLVDQECNAEKCSPYGSVYAIAQTAVSLAYGFGPLFGGKLSETYGFPQVMRTVGIINFIYMPLMYFLRNEHEEISRENDEISRAESIEMQQMKEDLDQP